MLSIAMQMNTWMFNAQCNVQTDVRIMYFIFRHWPTENRKRQVNDVSYSLPMEHGTRCIGADSNAHSILALVWLPIPCSNTLALSYCLLLSFGLSCSLLLSFALSYSLSLSRSFIAFPMGYVCVLLFHVSLFKSSVDSVVDKPCNTYTIKMPITIQWISNRSFHFQHAQFRYPLLIWINFERNDPI